MQRLIDTNYLLRYLLQDNEKMFALACQAIKEGAETRPESILECVYVLNKAYGLERKEISKALIILLDEITISDKEAIRNALILYGKSSLDYADCLYIAISKERGERVLTFDKKMNNMMDRLGIPKD